MVAPGLNVTASNVAWYRIQVLRWLLPLVDSSRYKLIHFH